MKLPGWCALLMAASLAACSSVPNDKAAPLQELVPTGKLRVGIGVGTVSSAFWTTRDAATGRPRGVTVDIGSAMARQLGVPVELVAYSNSGEVTAAGMRGEWDVAFMPVDAERMKMVDFGPAYFLNESTYLVPPGSAIRSIAEVDRPGVRVVGITGTTTARAAAASLKNTTVQGVRTTGELTELLHSGKADAVALGRDSLNSLAASFPGARVLDGAYLSNGVAVAVPKNHPAALAWVSAFIESAKSSGVVRRALDDAGLRDAPVAPPARQ